MLFYLLFSQFLSESYDLYISYNPHNPSLSYAVSRDAAIPIPSGMPECDALCHGVVLTQFPLMFLRMKCSEMHNGLLLSMCQYVEASS